jgi:uncharacterized 2Fe-2S/4Fe-4S cluster protein (DUF4445 family)
MGTHRVTFLPSGASIEVETGITIAEAARKADVFINNLCGGEGVCGQCAVRITAGTVNPNERSEAFFSQEELRKGFVLSCQTPVTGDLEISVPSTSRLEGEQIMTGTDESAASSTEDRPLVTKVYLELPPPTGKDNTADIQRITRELRRRLGWHNYEISLDCLKHLSERLRSNDWKVTAVIARSHKDYRIIKIEPGDTTGKSFGVAVDVGTTTIAAQLVDLNSRKVLGAEGALNMQASYGADVISRMIYACGKGGLSPLQEAVIRNINELIDRLIDKNPVDRDDINAVVAAGNTTMSHFLLGLTPCSIRLDPYVPTADLYPQARAAEIGISLGRDTILETLPSVASYVGGDIVAGVMACGMAEGNELRGLIDVGTNGEIALGNKDWLVCCSASAGPAFEGGGTRCGMRAVRGAIEKVQLKGGELDYQTIGGARPRGICGSGLIDCIHELVVNGVIGADGKFDRNRKDERLTIVEEVPAYIIAGSEESEDGNPVVITESDIANLIKSKGAIFAAIKSLVDYVGMDFDQIDTFYVAGGFGNYLNIGKAIAIGLLPDMPVERIRFIGNSSLAGARMCLLSEKAFEKCLNISRSMTNIELSTYQPFMDEYIAALFLPHTDRRLFPSVAY